VGLYYIINSDEKTGPFDVVSMVRKIRNGKLEAHHMILIEGEENPISANEVKVLHDYFMDMTFNPERTAKAKPAKPFNTLDLKESLTNGWRDYEENQRTSLIVAYGLAGLLTAGALFASILPITGALFLLSALTGALFYTYTLFIGIAVTQWPSRYDFQQRLKQKNTKRLLGLGFVLGILCFGLPIFLWEQIGPLSILASFIGYLLFASTLFAPLICLDNHDISARTSIRQSLALFKSLNTDSIIKLTTIQLLNYFAMLIFLFPLLISLPATQFAWVNIYRRLNTPEGK
jgi:hypothetical protein